jgi:histidine triad (HIT) family protein
MPIIFPYQHYDARVTTDCVFCGIVAGRIPATVVHETETTLAFQNIAPQAPVHLLVVPKAHHEDLASLGLADAALAGELIAAIAAVAEAAGLRANDAGFRVIFNSGGHGGQEVFHVHAHVVGGHALGPMLVPGR